MVVLNSRREKNVPEGKTEGTSRGASSGVASREKSSKRGHWKKTLENEIGSRRRIGREKKEKRKAAPEN